MYILSKFALHCVYLPLIYILTIILSPFTFMQKRRVFENKNRTDLGAKSFRKLGEKADHCFEFSSEGEFQQVAPVIFDLLAEGKKLELVFFSPSVEEQIQKLHEKFPSQIRYLRYPVFSLRFSSWITAKNLILVRYDFFPEFLVWAMNPDNKLKIVLATFKSERAQNKKPNLFKRSFLRHSSVSIFATPQDLEMAKGLGFHGEVFDLRGVQIIRRLKRKTQHFQENFKNFATIENFIKSSKLIVGNAWPADIDLLKDISQSENIVIVPHQLTQDVLVSMQEKLQLMGRSSVVVDDFTQTRPEVNTIILNKKGVLCELYSFFPMAYIGGGLGVSVHSILEPLLAGVQKISCGPVNHRSTEFEWAQHFNKMTVTRSASEFSEWFNQELNETTQNFDALISEEAYDRIKKVLLG